MIYYVVSGSRKKITLLQPLKCNAIYLCNDFNTLPFRSLDFEESTNRTTISNALMPNTMNTNLSDERDYLPMFDLNI